MIHKKFIVIIWLKVLNYFFSIDFFFIDFFFKHKLLTHLSKKEKQRNASKEAHERYQDPSEEKNEKQQYGCK